MKMSEALKGGVAALALVATAACGGTAADKPVAGVEIELPEITVADADLEGNPFRADWTGQYGVPPFAEIRSEHFKPAILKGILETRAEIAAIVDNAEAPTFENTILAYERTGKSLNKVLGVFRNLSNTDTNADIQALEAEIYPMLSTERDAVTFNPKLFARVKAVYDQRDRLGLDEQDARLLELTHRGFVRAGAGLSPDVQAEVSKINAELSGLTTQYGQNLLAASKDFKLVVTDEARLKGLSPDFKNALDRDGDKTWEIGLDLLVFEGFMTAGEDRELRSQLFDGYRLRANSGEWDNGAIALKVAQLRAKRAELMGYKSHAHYVIENRMAKTPEAAVDFLVQVLEPALKRAAEEQADMEKLAYYPIQGHDWWFYAEKVRADKYALTTTSCAPISSWKTPATAPSKWPSACSISLTRVDVASGTRALSPMM